MVVKDNVTWQPKWVPLPILDFARIVHSFAEDKDALAQWVKKFADDLLFCNLDSTDDFTIELLSSANEKYTSRATACKKAGKASAKARMQKQKSQEVAGNGNAPDASANGLEEYHDQEPASGNYQVPDKVSTNNGDAARREAADGETDGNVATIRITVSEQLKADGDIRKDSQDRKSGTSANPLTLDSLDSKDSNPRGYNTADVPPSYGPEDGTIDNPATPAGSSHPAGNAPPQFVINHNQRHRPQKPQANSPPRSSEDVRLFALDRNLDIDDARMWYQMNFVDRPGCDKDGVAINNWKGHCTAYCKAEAERRKAG